MNEKGELSTNMEETQTIVREYYLQWNANKLGNLEEMDAFLEIYKLPKLKQEEIENQTRPVTSKATESKPSQQTSLGPDGFPGEF